MRVETQYLVGEAAGAKSVRVVGENETEKKERERERERPGQTIIEKQKSNRLKEILTLRSH